jgi:uncharacterized protein
VSAYYLDSSALAKRYLVEPGTAWIRGITDPGAGHAIIASEITRVEVAAAIGARHRGNTITNAERALAFDLLVQHTIEEYQMVAVDPSVLDRAMQLTQVRRLRGYDAVQLATALAVGDTYRQAGLSAPVFVSADRDLLAAAEAEGLQVEDPNARPQG